MAIKELRIAREETTRETIRAFKDVSLKVLESPLFQMLFCVALVELGQMIKPDGKHQIITDVTGSAIESVIISGEALKSISAAVSTAIPGKVLAGLLTK